MSGLTFKPLVAPGGAVSDGNKGDITVSNNGDTWLINDAARTIDKVLEAGNETERHINYQGLLTDETTGTESFVYTPSNYGVDYPGHGEAMGFQGGWQRFNGVNPSGRPNVVATLLGYNHTLGGGRISGGEAGFAFRAETHFEISSDVFEFHMPEVTSYAGVIKRPFSMYIDKATAGAAINFLATASVAFENLAGNPLFSFNANGNYIFKSSPGINGLLELVEVSTGGKYQLQVDGANNVLYHNTFGNKNQFDGPIEINSASALTYPLVINTHANSAHKGAIINGVSAGAAYPVEVTVTAPGGMFFNFHNASNSALINLTSAGANQSLGLRSTGTGFGWDILNQGSDGILYFSAAASFGIRFLQNSDIITVGGLSVGSTPVYADNAAALAGGLTAGYFYRTGDILKVVH